MEFFGFLLVVLIIAALFEIFSISKQQKEMNKILSEISMDIKKMLDQEK